MNVFVRVAPEGEMRKALAEAVLYRLLSEDCELTIVQHALTYAQNQPKYWRGELVKVYDQEFHLASKRYAAENAVGEYLIIVDDDQLPLYKDWVGYAVSLTKRFPEYSASVMEIVDATASEPLLRDVVFALVRMLRPEIVVETGAYKGGMTAALGLACKFNGNGRVASCEPNQEFVDEAREACVGLPVGIRRSTSAELSDVERADFLFLDSDYKYRREEIERAKKGAVIVIHDAYKSYDPNIAPLAPLIESLGGIAFRCGIEGRGFGILVKR